MRTLFILFFICTSYLLSAQLPKGYYEKYYEKMRYGLFIPTSYDAKKSYPLILYLHGSTDTTSWDHKWYHDPIQTDDPCFVLTPKTTDPSGGWGHTWNKKHTKPMELTLELLNSLIKEYNIDTTRLYVCGTSMGGFGTFSVLAKEEGKFAAAYIICGGGNPEVSQKYLKTPIWIFHGEIDDVVPMKLSRQVYNEMIKLGGKIVRYTSYPNVKHNSWENAGKEPSLTKWFMLQKKGSVHQSPNPVKSLTTSQKDGKIELKWEPGEMMVNTDTDIWYYKVFRDKELITELDNSITLYVDTQAEPGKNYKYSVVAVNFFFKESGAVEALSK